MLKDKMWTAKEAAEYVQMSVGHLYVLCRTLPQKTRPPAYRIGKNLRFPRNDFIAWTKSTAYGASNDTKWEWKKKQHRPKGKIQCSA